MPDTATLNIAVEDNDSYLSGDSRHNENATDRSGQQASITADGNVQHVTLAGFIDINSVTATVDLRAQCTNAPDVVDVKDANLSVSWVAP